MRQIKHVLWQRGTLNDASDFDSAFFLDQTPNCEE